jgi:hypothetical protein
MNTTTSLLLAIPLALLTTLGSGCVISSSDDDSTLTVENQSSFVVEDLFVVESFSTTWGPDLLGADALFPGESITILLECGIYDALVVDEDGFECQLLDLDLCFDDAVWVIDDLTLNQCV